MASRFAAVDVETATRLPGSICQIGVAVDDGEIEAEAWLVRPPGNRFIDEFVDIHHIDSAACADAPDFIEVWPQVRARIAGCVPVSHNAEFDDRQINAALRRAGSDETFGPSACTLRMAHLLWFERQRSFALVNLCEDWGIPLGEGAHDASYDAVATLHLAELLLDEWQHSGGGDLWDLIDASDDGAEERSKTIMQRLFKINGSLEAATAPQAKYLAALAEERWLDPDEIVAAADSKYRASQLIDVFLSGASLSRDELEEAIAAIRAE
ncbi:MAG: hypothetical protein F4Z31_01665 [Gemmatimonadetes bacterium]|nr:hypothetical protein [Gemmatimonadota bacterium]